MHIINITLLLLTSRYTQLSNYAMTIVHEISASELTNWQHGKEATMNSIID